jgi:hypothetical protein
MPQPPLPGGRFQKLSHGLQHYKIEPRLAPLISIISFNYPLYELVRMECRPFQPIRVSAQIVCQVLTRFSDPVTLLAPSSLSSYPSRPMASQVVWPLKSDGQIKDLNCEDQALFQDHFPRTYPC